MADNDAPNGFDDKLKQRAAAIADRPLETVPKNIVPPHHRIPNTPLAASTISFLLGSTFALSLLTFLVGGIPQFWWATWELGFFSASWAAFHWLEFAVTAGWNREKCSVDSFLLDNGAMYHIANGVAVSEYLITLYFKPSWKQHLSVTLIGILLVIGGQILRSAAMIHASTNFSHAVAYRKVAAHSLVTDGVYSYFRHPSYAGFYYWAIGTQLVLQNPLTFVFYAVILWKFFHARTKDEEKQLIKFFGDDYVQYRKRVGTKIPFVP